MRSAGHSMWLGWWVQVVIVIISIPSVVRALTDPSPWRLTVLVVWLLLAVQLCLTGYVNLADHHRAGRRVADPMSVPFDDVVAALETTTDRDEAVADLRERHPGLGLAHAVELIDEVAARPDR